MKIGTHPEQDPYRVAVARKAIGDRALFVDSNGAYGAKRAQAITERLAKEYEILWHEEPVSSDDLEGLRLIREGARARGACRAAAVAGPPPELTCAEASIPATTASTSTTHHPGTTRPAA